MESLVKDQSETATVFWFFFLLHHSGSTVLNPISMPCISVLRATWKKDSGKQCSRGWNKLNKNLLQCHSSDSKRMHYGLPFNNHVFTPHAHHVHAPPTYQETSITANRRAHFNLHVIAMEARCAAVNKEHGGSGFSEASVCSSLTRGPTCLYKWNGALNQTKSKFWNKRQEWTKTEIEMKRLS